MPSHSDQHFHGSDDPHNTLPTHSSRPLIDLVTNDWRQKEYRDDSFDSDDSYSHFMSEKDGFKAPSLPFWVPHLKFPRRVQRYLLGYLFFLIACWIGWLYWLRPAWAEEQRLDESLAKLPKSGPTFGANTRPEFTDMVHMQELETELVPRSSAGNRRLIFIGDVHGCTDELQKLLEKVSFNQEKDHVVFTGDLVSKGPDSIGALDIAMKIGATCVRGNHEDRVILAHRALNAKIHPLQGPQENPSEQEDFLGEESFSHGDYMDRKLAKSLSNQQVMWLKKCPVVLRVGPIGHYNGDGDVVVVHGGLVPGVKLRRQDPFLVMNMRTIDLATRVPSEGREGEPWEKLWNHHQAHTHPPSERTTVIYGHDSKRGLRLEKYSKGIDSSCVRGGKLTALIIDSRGRQKIVSVGCKDYRK